MSGILPLSDLPQLLPRGTCHSVNATCPVSKSFYGYTPALGPNVALLVIFSIALVAHGVQGIYYRAWGTLTAMGWGCICEVLGYAGRLMMHPNAFNLNGSANSPITRGSVTKSLQDCRFLIQICLLTIAPAFYSAAIYICLSRL